MFQKTEECIVKIACLEDESSLCQQVDSITFEIFAHTYGIPVSRHKKTLPCLKLWANQN